MKKGRVIPYKFNFVKISILLLSGVLFTACSGSTQRESRRLYEAAKVDFANGNYNAAKLRLDSIDKFHRADIDLRSLADTLSWQIEIKENLRNIAYYDSTIQVFLPEIEAKSKDFVSTGDSAILGYDVLIHKSQGRSYLPHTNLLSEVHDNGDLYLISVFMGRQLNHTSFEVSAQGLFKKSEEVPLSAAANNRFDDMDIRWEYVTYKPSLQNETAEFVAEYADDRIMVTLNGENSVYKFYMEQRDKNAIKESVELATMLKALRKIQKDKRIAEDNVAWIQSRLNGERK